MNVVIDTSFGLTIVATLGLPPDLSGSYLYFKNSGTNASLFTIDALVQASYDTGDIELFGLENFGGAFSVPGILTVVCINPAQTPSSSGRLTDKHRAPTFVSLEASIWT